jgi:D-beta-D-heptose 7-phosphate kinase/D-beta-D-heptose 1-phosphate adenosyltransferase
MVLATIGLALACGLGLDDALRLANVAGGLEVEKVGVVPITRDEIRLDLLQGSRDSRQKVFSLEQMLRLAEVHRSHGERIVLADGCFDLLHMGHLSHLAEAAAQGDVLLVGLQSDACARAAKGSGRPVINERDRALMLSALACVDYVTLVDEPTLLTLVRRLRPDVWAKGADYQGRIDEIPGASLVQGYGGRIHLTQLVEGVSTTRLVQLLAA